MNTDKKKKKKKKKNRRIEHVHVTTLATPHAYHPERLLFKFREHAWWKRTSKKNMGEVVDIVDVREWRHT